MVPNVKIIAAQKIRDRIFACSDITFGTIRVLDFLCFSSRWELNQQAARTWGFRQQASVRSNNISALFDYNSFQDAQKSSISIPKSLPP